MHCCGPGTSGAGMTVGAPRDAQWGHGRRDLQLDSSPTHSWGSGRRRLAAEVRVL